MSVIGHIKEVGVDDFIHRLEYGAVVSQEPSILNSPDMQFFP